MHILMLATENIDLIAHLMNNGVWLEELNDMIEEDLRNAMPRYFIKTRDEWMFIREVELEHIMYALIRLKDS